MGPISDWAQSFGVSPCENPQNRKICENGPIFQEKCLTMGTLFCQNDPQRWIGVLRLKRHILVQTKSELPPPVM